MRDRFDWWSGLLTPESGLLRVLGIPNTLMGIQAGLDEPTKELGVDVLQRRRAVRSWDASTRFSLSDLTNILKWATAKVDSHGRIYAAVLECTDGAKGVFEWTAGVLQLSAPWHERWNPNGWLRQPSFASAAAIVHFSLPCPATDDVQYVRSLVTAGALSHLCWLRAADLGFSGCLFEGFCADGLSITGICRSNEVVAIALALGFEKRSTSADSW